MSFGENSPLPKWRQRLWPVRAFELKKVIPLLLMKFFISFNYGILTSMKDAFVVTAKGAGAEVIPILKGWIVLPIALGVAVLFSKLSNHYKRSTLFYWVIFSFLAFIALYAFVLYPNINSLSPHESADWLLTKVGQKNAHWVAIYRNWIQSIFFVVAELWAQVVIFLLFWVFVNQICNFQEAKRSYNLFIAGGDIAQILIGPLVWFCTKDYLSAHFELGVQKLVYFVLFFGFMIMLLHWYMNRFVLKDPRLYQPQNREDKREEKTKLSLWDSIKFICRSKTLFYMAGMVIAYGLTINLVEVTWKAHLKLVHPDTGSYQSFMAGVGSSVGVISLFSTLLLSGPIVRTLGWRFCALIPPTVIGTTSLIMLTLFIKPEWVTPLAARFEVTPLMFIVLFGALHNVSSKVMKYAFFDSTKEMAYIPLDHESKVKGKAAIDVVGSRLGKSGAAWVQIVLIQIAGTGSVLSITHFLIPLIACTVLFWIYSVRSLNTQVSRIPESSPKAVNQASGTL